MNKKLLKFIIICLAGISIRVKSQTFIIRPVAGADSAGYTGDGGAATNARLNSPAGVAIDKNDNVYIADYNNNAIRKVTTKGIISTIAGNGNAGSIGDGGPATAAQLSWPSAVAVDDSGNIYISDNLNSRIRKINTNGVINTIAGTGVTGYMGDGGAATAAWIGYPEGIAFDTLGNIYFCDNLSSVVRKINKAGIITTIAGTGTSGYSGDGSQATVAELHGPNGVTVDRHGNVYIGDLTNSRIREINTNGIIKTICGTGVYGIGQYGNYNMDTLREVETPEGLFIDKLNYLYFADAAPNYIGVISPTGKVSTVAGNYNPGYNGDYGFATSAELWNPSGIVFDPVTGVGYIADQKNNRVRELAICRPEKPAAISGNRVVDTGVNYTYSITPVPGATSYQWILPTGWQGSSTTTSINVKVEGVKGYLGVAAVGLCSASDTQWVYVGVNMSLPTYKISTFAGNGNLGYSGDGGPATAAEIYNPDGVAIDRSGNVYITDYESSVIRKVNTKGIISTIAGNGQPGTEGDGGPATAAQVISPMQINVDRKGNIYFADGYDEIREINSKGIITDFAGNSTTNYRGDGGPATAAELFDPPCATPDTAGNVYIADQINDVVREVKTNDTIYRVAGAASINDIYFMGGPAIDAETGNPRSISVDDSNNYYIVADQDILKVNTKKIINIVAGGGVGPTLGNTGFAGDSGYATSAVISPTGTYVDRLGNIYIADEFRVRFVNAGNGVINTVAGNGEDGYSGDGGLSTAAEMAGPTAITMDAKGRIYLADYGNGCIRVLSVCTPVTPNKILGPATLCAGSKQVYSIIPVPGATSYTWVLPLGWSGTSTDTSISVIAGSAGGNISVAAIGDTSCGGSSAPRVFTVKVTPSFAITISAKDTTCYGVADTIKSTGGVKYLWSNGATTSNIIVNPVSSVTYTVGINNGSCTRDTSITIHSSILQVGVNPPSPSVCQGSSISLTPNGGVSYVWMPATGLNCSTCPNPGASPTVTTTYTVTGTSNLGCKGTDSVVVKVVQPVVANVSFKDSIVAGATDVLTASGGTSYAWSTGKTGNSISVKPDSTTTYWVVINNSPCPADTFRLIVIVMPTSVQNINQPDNIIAVFPNPFTTSTSIVFNTIGKHYLEVDDITGRKIESMQCTGKQYELSSVGLAKGIYIVRAYDAGMNYVATAKVVVQ